MTYSLHDIARAHLEATIFQRVARNIRNATDSELANLAAPFAESAGVSMVEFRGKERRRFVAHPRQDFMRAAYDAGYSLPRIGKFLKRDHTTVLHGIRASRKREAAE